MRCDSCKKERNNPLTYWDRFKLWLATFLTNDINDLRAESFTSGFGDGYKKGFEDAKTAASGQVAYLESRNPIPLDFQVDLHDVVDLRKEGGKLFLFIGGLKATQDQVRELKNQAIVLQPTRLWRIMQETVKQKAIEKAVIESKTWEEALSGKMMLHDLGLLRSIVDAIEKSDID